jgi:hypothetical protein
MSSENLSESALERVIRKIKRCLALSQSSNETEAATALRQAQALMRKYQLTETDVKLSDVGEVESSHARATRRPSWDRDLGAVVADVFNCKALSLKHWCNSTQRRVERAVFVGVTPAQQIALYAYEALLAKVTMARREYVAGVRAGKNRSAYSPETAGDHFAIAWVGQVYGKLKRLLPQGEEDVQIGQGSNGRDLVALESESKALIDRYLSSQEIGKHRQRPQVELDLDAQIAGMLAGMKVDLNAGLTSGGAELQRINQAQAGAA